MAGILNGLHDDHKNIARLLVLLEHELAILADAHVPDYELLEDIMRYATGYPDTHHHPTEDIVFRHLKARAPETAPDIEAILDEHHALRTSGQRFLQAIEAVEHEALVRRTDLIRRGRAYADLLKGHMDAEEGLLFPQARAKLTASDWDAIGAAIEARPDPLFGAARAADFQRLWQRILDHAPL